MLPVEWRWVILWSIVVVALSCVPYLVAMQAAPVDWHFAGILVNPLDGHSYLAKIEQGVMNQWLFHLTYTPEPHEGAFIYTFYLALGHVARVTGLSNVVVFHLARVATGFLLLLTAFHFIGRVTPHQAERRLAFVFILSASGLGWLGAVFSAFPIDLWVPEAFTPYSLYTNPHFPLAMTLMLVIFLEVVWPDHLQPDAVNSHPHLVTGTINLKAIFLIGLAAFALAIVLPFALLTVWAVLVAFLVWQLFLPRGRPEVHSLKSRLPWTQIWPTLSAIFFPMPVILYQYWLSTTHPILAGWSAQNITAAPSGVNFILGYGFIGVLAVAGIVWIIWRGGSTATKGERFVIIWAVTTVVLVYFPFNLQRRLITGLHLPLCILGAIGLVRWSSLYVKSVIYRRLMMIVVVTIGALGTLFVWSLPLIAVWQSPAASPVTALLFIRDDERLALNWLSDQVEPDSVILASPRVGMFVPAQTGARAFYGHPLETIEAKEKREQVEAFYHGTLETTSPSSDYIIYGPSEQALGRPEILSELPVVYSTGEVFIYRAVKP